MSKAVFSLALLSTSIGAVACIRVLLISLAMPPSTLLTEVTSLTGSAPTGTVQQNYAMWLAELFHDAALVTALLSDCENAAPNAEAMPDDADFDTCFEVTRYGLLSEPLSGELWLELARTASALGRKDFVVQGLRNSFYTSPREGWIASRRLVTVLQIYDELPPDVIEKIQGDIEIVLSDRRLMGPLISAYLREAEIRRRLPALIERLPIESQQLFLRQIESRIR